MPDASRCVQVLIIVLGDLGRSPRMLNHARVMRRRGWAVTLAGYGTSALPPDLEADSAVRVCPLDAGGVGLGRILVRLAGVVRREYWTVVLVQNPPGFPVLAVVVAAVRRGARIVLDWHNLGSSLLALRTSAWRHGAGLYAWAEREAARWVDEHWAVSAALAKALPVSGVVVVRDRPAGVFRARAEEAVADRAGLREAWWRRVLPQVAAPKADCWVVAPSSWGADEDVAAMLRVAEGARAAASEWGDAPRVALIATGRGEGQEAFARAAAAMPEGPISLQCVWVPAGEYPALLALADVGLCLHRSSSGLDLPMKLADFRGAGCRALVLDYGPVLAEIFDGSADGWTFADDAELLAGLRRVAGMASSERRVERRPDDTWEAEWIRELGGWATAIEGGAGRS